MDFDSISESDSGGGVVGVGVDGIGSWVSGDEVEILFERAPPPPSGSTVVEGSSSRRASVAPSQVESPRMAATSNSPASLLGMVHLGERFRGQLVITNRTSGGWRMWGVHVRVELQTSSHRYTLLDGRMCWPDGTDMIIPAAATTATDQNIGAAIDSFAALIVPLPLLDVKETGVHVVQCAVSYSLEGLLEADNHQQRRLHRKHFKFTVTNPLQLKTKVNDLSSLHPSSEPPSLGQRKCLLLVEALLMNASTVPIYLDSVRFEPQAPYQAGLLEPTPNPQQDQSLLLLPRAMHQYVFSLIIPPPSEAEIDETTTPSHPMNLGRLDIRWRRRRRSATQDYQPHHPHHSHNYHHNPADMIMGRLQTGTLVRKAIPQEALLFRIAEYPHGRVSWGQPFWLVVELGNRTERPMQAVTLTSTAMLESPKAVLLPHGPTSVEAAQVLGPGETVTLRLGFVPIRRAGLYQVSGLWVHYEDHPGNQRGNEGVRHSLPRDFVIYIDESTE